MARTHQTCQQQSAAEIKAIRVEEVLLQQPEGIMLTHVPYSWTAGIWGT